MDKRITTFVLSLSLFTTAINQAISEPSPNYDPLGVRKFPPDLIISDIRTKEFYPCTPNRPVMIAYVSIRNIGRGASKPALNQPILTATGNRGAWNSAVGIPSIAPNETKVVQLPFMYLSATPERMNGGTWWFQAHLNRSRTIPESNYDNNMRPFPVAIFCFPHPDITSRGPVSVNAKSAPWGGTLYLNQKDALSAVNGVCTYRLRYPVISIGSPTQVPGTTLSKAGRPIATHTTFVLNGGESKMLTTDVALRPGQTSLDLTLDPANQVRESDESNNRFRVRLIVNGRCR